MTPIKLQNPENQAKFTALFDEFHQKKGELIALDDELKNLESKQAKNAATLTAVRNEFDAEIGKIKAKFDAQSELTLDDYSATQKLKAELKSRVDFFNAVGEELDAKIYDKKEKIYFEKYELLKRQRNAYYFLANVLINEFIEKNKEEIGLFKGLFVSSFGYDSTTGKDGYDEFNEMILKKLTVPITTPTGLDSPLLSLSSEWRPKTPTQKHLEQFQDKEAKGFKSLLNNM